MPKRRRNGRRSRLSPSARRLLLFVLIFVILNGMCNIWGLKQVSGWLAENDEEAAMAMEATRTVLLIPVFGPDHVFVSLLLSDLAQTEGISEMDLKFIIAAAATRTPRLQEETHAQWLERVFTLSGVLLGIAKVESSYCNNIGSGLAYQEVGFRLERARVENPSEVPYWEANLRALEQIAANMHEPVESIPGSIGAGAISCFQLMPTSWLAYGGGDYRRTFQAASNSSRFLMAHGYPDNPEGTIANYNPNAGQPYVDSVLAAIALWRGPITTAYIEPPLPINLATFAMVYLELFGWYTGDYKLAGIGVFGPAGEFVNPYPGSSPVSYFWNDPVYGDNGNFLINHPAQDLGGISGGQIVAAHPGRVTFARYLCPNRGDSLCENASDPAIAARWWISGVVTVIQGEFPDGSPVCTYYGHGAMGSLAVGSGDVVSAGQHIMDAGSTGWSSGVHLHFAVSNCDGTFWDPNPYLP